MSNYRKLVAGLIGVSLILLKHFTGIELPGLGDHLLEVAMAIGTWVSIWWFPNDESSVLPQHVNTRVGGVAGEAERAAPPEAGVPGKAAPSGGRGGR